MRAVKKNNVVFNVDDKHYTWWDNVEKDLWEVETFNIIDKFVNKDSNCIDLGAWIGPITLYLSKLSNIVYSIEPDSIAYEDLKKSVCLNDTGNIRLFNFAIFNYNGKMQLGNNQDLGNSTTRLNQDKNIFNVDCYTLSSFCKNNNINKVDFIKVDVEGCEEFIFEDLNFFNVYKPTVYIQIHAGWFVNRKIGNNIIQNVAKLYKNIYQENFTKIDFSMIDGGCLIFSDL